MGDRRGQEIHIGDEVLVHLYLGDYRSVVRLMDDVWVYVSGVSVWEPAALGGMFPENVTVIESVDMDIGL